MKNLIVTASVIVFSFICMPRAEASGVAAEIITPAPGSTLTASTVLFQWNSGTNVSKYWLWAGRARGGFELFDQDLGTSQSVTLGLPTDGCTVYVRLFSWIDGEAKYYDYAYTTTNTGGCAPPTAQMITPAPASTLTSSTVTFQWTGGTGASQYWLTVGSTAGAQDFYSQGLTSLSTTASALPTDGRTVYARLWWRLNGDWQYNDYIYTAR